MRLHEIEPSFGPGRSQPIASMVGELMAPKRPSCGPFLLAIDGRSSNGKSTLAERIAAVMSGSSVVHTDDVAWWQSRFGWNDLLISGVIEPLRHEEAVDYRPPAWDARDRPDSIASPAEAALVVIEGVDSGRSSLAQRVDAVIWVQPISTSRNAALESGSRQARSIRLVTTVGCRRRNLQAHERTWEFADLIVSGASAVDEASEIVVVWP